ncbi:SRPBCC family protein [Rugosimonospora africana]|uniref:Coenzyme Q-binding protein COQ10 START domain-containing protein n=1 Tax=Rugosimonospora africana TaxID=556532 RepID=A0A8J3VR76_9ACTN|nr:SRPBCC family protein [Rugosimonospora africana]GIH15834.1 hypothetical protein Raf01_40060 [Rugosimonospora africana]
MNWPIGEFDDLRRLRVLHAALPGTMLAETVLPASFDRVWSVLGDVEKEFPGLVPDVRSIRVVERDGERMRALVRGRSGLRAPFEMVLRPGWCLMRSRFLVFGMAAVPAGDHTRFGYLAGLRVPGKRVIAPLLAPAQRRLARAVLHRFERRFTPAGR